MHVAVLSYIHDIQLRKIYTTEDRNERGLSYVYYYLQLR